MLFMTLRRTVLSIAACAPLAAWAGSDEAPLSAYWVRHAHELNYVGYTAHYSCDGLRDTLKQLLRAAGARDDVKVVMACSNPIQGPSRIASATVTFYTLALAPPAPAATGSPAAVPAPGAWKRVEWRAAHPVWLGEGDCELIEHFDRELLPLFTTRNRVSHLECVPHETVVGGLSLAFESLAPLPRVAQAAAPRPQ
jgi:hypothetical protein